MGQLADPNFVPHRVGTQGNTANAVALIQKQYGFNINDMGRYTKHQVRALAIAAKDARLQALFAKEALANIEKIIEYRNEVDRLKGEAIKKGLKGKEEVDKYVLNAMLETHGHEAHIKKIFQDMKQGMSLIDAKSGSQLALGDNAFQHKLRELSKRHSVALQGQNLQARATLNDISEDLQRQKVAQAKQQGLMAYIRGKDYEPNGTKRPGFSWWG